MQPVPGAITCTAHHARPLSVPTGGQATPPAWAGRPREGFAPRSGHRGSRSGRPPEPSRVAHHGRTSGHARTYCAGDSGASGPGGCSRSRTVTTSVPPAVARPGTRPAAAAPTAPVAEATSSEETGAQAALRSDAASGWQPSSVAGAGSRRETDADPGGRRLDVAGAVRAALAWRDGAGGDDGDVRDRTGVRDPGVLLHGPCGVGFRHSRGRGQGEQDAPDPGGRGAETTRRRAHPVLLTTGERSL